MPHFFHVVPVGDHAMLDWVLDFEDTAFLLGLLANIDLSLVKANHDAWNLGTAYYGRKHGAGGVISGETRLAGARTVVNHYSRYFFVNHCLLSISTFRSKQNASFLFVTFKNGNLNFQVLNY